MHEVQRSGFPTVRGAPTVQLQCTKCKGVAIFTNCCGTDEMLQLPFHYSQIVVHSVRFAPILASQDG